MEVVHIHFFEIVKFWNHLRRQGWDEIDRMVINSPVLSIPYYRKTPRKVNFFGT